MGMTHTQLRSNLGSMLEVDTNRYSDAMRTIHINQALREIQQDSDEQAQQATDTFSTVASTQSYAPATAFGGGSPSLTFSHPLGMYYADSDGDEVEVEQLTWQELRATYPLGTDEGDPKHFAVYMNKIWLGPIPDAVHTIYVDYIGYLGDLSGDSDSNWWTLNEPMLVLYKAAIHACVYLLEDERLPMFHELAEAAWARVVIHLSQIEQAARRPESTEYTT